MFNSDCGVGDIGLLIIPTAGKGKHRFLCGHMRQYIIKCGEMTDIGCRHALDVNKVQGIWRTRRVHLIGAFGVTAPDNSCLGVKGRRTSSAHIITLQGNGVSSGSRSILCRVRSASVNIAIIRTAPQCQPVSLGHSHPAACVVGVTR